MSTPELVSRVKYYWNELIQPYCSDTSLTDRFFEEIEKKYTGRSRHYHNLQHIAALLQLCEQYSHRLTDKDVVALAVFYHDIIYNVLRKDNEPRLQTQPIFQTPEFRENYETAARSNIAQELRSLTSDV